LPCSPCWHSLVRAPPGCQAWGDIGDRAEKQAAISCVCQTLLRAVSSLLCFRDLSVRGVDSDNTQSLPPGQRAYGTRGQYSDHSLGGGSQSRGARLSEGQAGCSGRADATVTVAVVWGHLNQWDLHPDRKSPWEHPGFSNSCQMDGFPLLRSGEWEEGWVDPSRSHSVWKCPLDTRAGAGWEAGGQ
jgi:hypothetical protein